MIDSATIEPKTQKPLNAQLTALLARELLTNSNFSLAEGESPFFFFPGSPGSDIIFSVPESAIYWGRAGNDTFLGFDPSDDNLERQQIDIFIGDLLDEELFATEESTPPSRDGHDRFILGDWQQPYYVGDQPPIFGLNQLAIISDFNPAQDIIQLHGIPEDYQLVKTPFGTGIFWQQKTVPDLIAFLPAVYDLSLENDYFQFEGDTPPEGPIRQKAQQFGTAGVDGFSGSATDSFGNVYIVGVTGGDASAIKYDSNGNQLWSQQFGTSSADVAWKVATDKEGNFYLVGVDNGNLAGSNTGLVDVWLAKYDSDGNQVWIQQLGNNNDLIDGSLSYSIDVDGDGNVYLSGHSGKPNDEFIYEINPWVTKYDSDGNQQWFQESGPSESVFKEAYGVAVGSDGSVYTTGWFSDEEGLYDVWLASHDNDGQLEWIQQFGSPDYEFSWGMDTDSEGNIYMVGWTLGNLGAANAGSYDAWVAKYDSDGDQVWLQQFGTEGDDGSYLGGIEVDSNDNIFLTGYTDSNLGGANSGSYDAWVAKYDSDGNQLWLQQFGTPELDYAADVTADSAGNLYVTGLTEGSFGDINAGSVDGWVAKLDTESGILQNFSGNTFDSLGVEENESNVLAQFPTIDALASLSEGLTQPIPGTAEALIGNNPLKNFVPILDFDFSTENFTNA